MCFDYSRALKLVVTGGLDPVVRLWNRYVPSRPSATLEGHLTTVLDVAIYHPVGQIFSYSRDDVSCSKQHICKIDTLLWETTN